MSIPRFVLGHNALIGVDHVDREKDCLKPAFLRRLRIPEFCCWIWSREYSSRQSSSCNRAAEFLVMSQIFLSFQ